MKFKIESLDELSDSRQIMESKPHKLTSIFIYILLTVIISFILWASFSEKEVVIKLTGIVNPNEESYVVSNPIAGEIKEVYMKNGQTIKKDAVLYKTDDTTLQIQKKKVEGQKKLLTNDINNLSKLKKSITDNTNYLKDNTEEKEYYLKYKNYEVGNNVSVEDKNNLINSKNDSINKINHLEKLSKSIEDNKNYNENGSIYNEQFNNYKISRKSIADKIVTLEKSKIKIQNQKDSNEQISQIDVEIQNVNNKLGALKKSKIELQTQKDSDDQLLQLDVEIQNNNNELSTLEKSKIELQTQKDSYKEQISQIDAEIQNNNNGLAKLESDIKLQVINSINELESQVKNTNSNAIKFDEVGNLSKEKNKTSLLAQIEGNLNLNDEKSKEIDLNLEEINKNIGKCEVKSNIDGRLDIKYNLEPGVMIQTGAIVANILPSSNNYKVELIIPDKDIGTIKKGQEVKYSFNSFPYNEYGFLKGSIKNISVNSQIDNKTGVSFYTGEGILKNNILYSHKNEKEVIKPGMTCDARIITRRENMLYYLLEKLNLKD